MNLEKYKQLIDETKRCNAKLIAVSKTKPAEDILKLYQAGQRIFGENKVQEMTEKYDVLPKDIQWHLIGHLQTNKVKYIAPFVAMIHSVDSLKLLQEINKQAEKNNRVVDCLLQVFVAQEETKFGFTKEELFELLESKELASLKNIRLCGLMAMATFTSDETQIEKEFAEVENIFETVKANYFAEQESFNEISMGMSSDYQLALKHGATLIRVGSILFGERVY